jgi:hypothetical protein
MCSIYSKHRLDSLLELIFASSRNIKQNAACRTGPIASFDQAGVRTQVAEAEHLHIACIKRRQKANTQMLGASGAF